MSDYTKYIGRLIMAVMNDGLAWYTARNWLIDYDGLEIWNTVRGRYFAVSSIQYITSSARGRGYMKGLFEYKILLTLRREPLHYSFWISYPFVLGHKIGRKFVIGPFRSAVTPSFNDYIDDEHPFSTHAADELCKLQKYRGTTSHQ